MRRPVLYAPECEPCRQSCPSCAAPREGMICLHPMRIEGMTMVCPVGHIAQRDPAAEMRAHGEEPLL